MQMTLWTPALLGALFFVGAPVVVAQDGNDPKAEEITAAQKKSALKLVKAGFSLYKKAKDTQALEKVEEALAANPYCAKAHYLKGEIRYQSQEVQAAATSFRKAVELDEKYVYAYDALGVCYLTLGKYIQAQESFQKALQLNKRFSDSHLHLGILRERQRKMTDAEREYRLAVRLNARSTFAHRRLGFMYLSQNKLRQAAASFLMVTRLDKRDVEALFAYGYCLDAQDKHSQAAAVYQKLLRIDKKHTGAWRNLGVTHERKGSKKSKREALKCYRTYVQLGGKDPQVKSWVTLLEEALKK